MIQVRQTLLAALLLLAFTSKAQQKEPIIFLKEGKVKTVPNITEASVGNFNAKAVRHRERAFAVLQFESLPSAETRDLLSRQGIELLEYIPENAYTASIRGKLNAALLKRAGARTLLQPTAKQKMHASLAKGDIPNWARKVKDKVDVWVSFPRINKGSDVVQFLKEKKMEVLSTQYQRYRILEVRVSVHLLDDLASFPFIEYVEPVPPEAQPLNMNSRNAARAGILNAAVADGGRGLNGEGVVIGVGDDGDVQSHADLSGPRLINKVSGYNEARYHAIHVNTTVAGAGVINEQYQGYAPKATLISNLFKSILSNADEYAKEYGMVLTNNSYGVTWPRCESYGEYTLESRMLDQQAFDLPHLQHVFAAGNEGRVTCDPYPTGFHTVFNALQAAKNVITVGATEWTGDMWAGSSKGPVLDGRLKPEITAQGAAVTSGALNNSYGGGWGTSMASPAVTGGLALLYQRYRQLHSGANPKNGLMKALLCNGGNDLGNSGPDYSYGFGWMHLLRSVEMLEKQQYTVNSLTHGTQQSHTIQVPANTAQLKVMLYWNDPPAAALSSRTLVNDLDLTVSSPGLAVNFPQVLDSSAAEVTNVAATGPDHINNMEQVVIDNPTTGTYTINISGAVAQNPSQEYFVVYDIIPVSVTLTNPAGGQGVASGERVQVNWDAYGDPAATFSLKFSFDNGVTWADINTAISAAARRYEWKVPDIATNQALIRIERNGTGLFHTSQPFTIIGVPSLSFSPVQCEGYIALTWQPVPGATDYEVMMKRGNEMVPVATTSLTTYTLNNLSRDSIYWVSVRARVNGKPGRRAVALARQPNNGTCAGSISDNDLKLDTIISPIVGRKYTSSELSSAYRVSLRIKNLDDEPVTGFEVKYVLNSNTWITETVGATIDAGATYIHTFTTTEDVSVAGNYSLTAVVKNNTPDPAKYNDTLYAVVRQLSNQAIELNTPFYDDLESAVTAVYSKSTMGLLGIDRYDFSDSSSNGLLTVISNQSAFSGTKSLRMEPRLYVPSVTESESLIGTFNLKDYNVSVDDIRLNFKVRYGNIASSRNKLLGRGSDNQSWIELLDMASYSNNDTSITSIELSNLLMKHGQDFSSSFQLRWSHGLGGSHVLILDDISIYKALDDLQLLKINDTVRLSCLGAPLQITLRNSSNKELTNVPVRFSLDSARWFTELIPSIAPQDTIQYRFNTPITYNVAGVYTIKVLVDFPTDNVRLNDTLSTVINYSNLSSVIKSFPYLQDFEAGDGGWYGSGANSAWEYGAPTATNINKAASGTKAWKTSKPCDPSDIESYILYSPCFEIGAMANPTLSFSLAKDLVGCTNSGCDAAWVEYSTDNQSWEQLIEGASDGSNWYLPEELYAWGEQKTRWHVVSIGLPKNKGTIRFRIIKYTDWGINTDGIAIDDFHIYDSVSAIYTGASPSIAITKAVSGNDWTHFESGGKLLASIKPNGQNLGATEVQAFIHSGAVRYTDHLYYHNRNITIKPEATVLTDSATVRLYFLDRETESLIGATGCNGCGQPESAYELDISKYSDPDQTKENGEVCDDSKADNWSFIGNKKIAIVPFQKGYYAEFKVKDFSEFWLHGGGDNLSALLEVKLPTFDPVPVTVPVVVLTAFPAGGAWSGPGVSGNTFVPTDAGTGTHTLTYTYTDSNGCKVTASTAITVMPPPGKLLTFTAERVNSDVVTKWSMDKEATIVRYEVEVSRGEADLQAGRFVRIGEVAARGNTTSVEKYSFIDTEPDKFGMRKYRLKIIHVDGSFTYSDEVTVLFSDLVTWQVYPNPSTGVFQLFVKINAGEELLASVYDTKGQQVKQYRTRGSGNLQKIFLDLSAPSYASGIYMLQTVVNGERKFLKLLKL